MVELYFDSRFLDLGCRGQYDLYIHFGQTWTFHYFHLWFSNGGSKSRKVSLEFSSHALHISKYCPSYQEFVHPWWRITFSQYIWTLKTILLIVWAVIIYSLTLLVHSQRLLSFDLLIATFLSLSYLVITPLIKSQYSLALSAMSDPGANVLIMQIGSLHYLPCFFQIPLPRP